MLKIGLRLITVFIFFAFFIITAEADIIYLKTGAKIEGIIEEETEGSIIIIMDIGKIGCLKTQIESISKSSDEENVKLKEKWLSQKEKERKEQEKWKKFAAEQEAKGLIFYQGQWITKEEFKRIGEQKAEKEQLRQVEKKTSTGAIIKKISDIRRIKLYVRAFVHFEDFSTGMVTIRGCAIFRDKQGISRAIDYGVAELSCWPWFLKSFTIHSENFGRLKEAAGQYAYPIYFKFYGFTGDEIARRGIFAKPSPKVTFRIGNLEATCNLK